MKTLNRMWNASRNLLGRALMTLAVLLALALGVGSASAQTDMTGLITAVSGYWTAVLAIAIPVLLFVIGRRVVRKI